MREHQSPPRSTAEPPVVHTRRLPIRGPADVALELQRTAGNRAAARVLARYTEPHKAEYEQARRQLEAIRELVAAVLSAHKSTFEFKGERAPLVQPLEAQIALYAETLRRWEATTDETVEGPLIKQAKEQLKQAAGLRPALLQALGGGDEAKGKQAIDRVLTARKESREVEAEHTRRQAEMAAQKAADAQRRTELAAVFAPAAAGPAYSRPANDELPQFHEHVRLSHRAFSELSLDQLRRPTCPLYLLTAAQLARVQTFAGAMTLSGWEEQSRPVSRSAALPFDRWIVPTRVPTLHFALGGEIFSDWVVENEGHGFSVGTLMEIWSFVLNNRGNTYMTVTVDGHRKVYEYRPQRRTETKIVTASNDTVLITCFDTRRR